MPRDPLHTRLCDLLEIEAPIICFTHCREVAVAALRSGIYAVLGEALRTPDQMADDIAWIREQTGNRSFGVDLVLPASSPRTGTAQEIYAEIPDVQRAFADTIHADFDVPEPESAVALDQWTGLNQKIAQRQIEALLDERIPVIATGLGAPDFLFAEARARGIKIVSLVGVARQARRQIERGADMIVAQGYDAAGHTGAMGTFSIVPDVVRVAGDVPVIAAGGVTTGRHLAAAICLGAVGVWSGTMWLASEESDVDPLMKQRILAADGDETDRTASISGKTMRVLRCPWTDAWKREDAPTVLKSPYQMMLTRRYLQGANDARRADLMTEAVGQGVAFVRESQAVGRIVADMLGDARGVFAAFRG